MSWHGILTKLANIRRTLDSPVKHVNGGRLITGDKQFKKWEIWFLIDETITHQTTHIKTSPPNKNYIFSNVNAKQRPQS